MFVVLSTVTGAWIAYVSQSPVVPPTSHIVMGGVFGLTVSGILAGIEIFVTKRFVTAISIVMFGVIFGFIVSFLILHALKMSSGLTGLENNEWIDFSITFMCCYLSVVAILQSKDDFKFVVPFIELQKQGKTGRPLILDTSVIIDGRIADICEKWAVDAPLILPRFIIDELQSVADSPDKLKRVRGRRGLDILNTMRKNPKIDIQIHEATFAYIPEVDSRLLKLTKTLEGVLVTNDFNLSKVAQLQGIEIININDLANALRPVLMPGDIFELKIVKAGEEVNQGIGYLDDGTMIVVEGGYSRIGQKVNVTVTSMLQTNAGRMIFATLGRS